MKILFIRPNGVGNRSIPLGISILQACLKKEGHSVRVFDTTFLSEEVMEAQKKRESLSFFLPTDASAYVRFKKCNLEEELSKEFFDYCPDLVAVSLMSNDIYLASKLSKSIKRLKNVPIIWGGVHPTIIPEEVIELDYVDMVCVGEGEEAFVELADKLQQGKNIDNIENIWTKSRRNPLRPLLNMDSLPMLDFSGFSQMHLYRPFWGTVYRILDIAISRGCFYSCYECINPYLQHLYQRCNYRRKSFEKAICELKAIRDKYKPEIFRFVDEIFLPDDRLLEEFVYLYKREIGIPALGLSRVEYLSEKRVRLLREMGFISLSMGVESGNDQIRRKMLNRYTNNDQIIKAFHNCRKYGIRTASFNLIALPEETRKNIFETIEVNHKANPDVAIVSFVYPYAKTPLWRYCLERGYISKNIPVVDYVKDTVIRNDFISRKEQLGLQKTFVLYILVPKWIYFLVRFCELDNSFSNWLFRHLQRYFIKRKFERNKKSFSTLFIERRLSSLPNPPLGIFE